MSKSTIGILIFTILIVVTWIGFDFYHASINTEFPVIYTSIKSANKFLDIEMLDVIDSKQTYNVYSPFEQSTEE